MWHKERLLSLDFETTSAEPEDARIVCAALAELGGGEETVAESWIVNPGVEIPDEAIEVHGITNEMARSGEDPRDVVRYIESRLYPWNEERRPLVIFQARFDLTILDRELRRLFGHGLFELGPVVVDPIVIERHLDRYRPKRVASHSLEDCCRVWNVVLDGAHDATFDAIAAARLAYRLAANGRVIRRARNESERSELAELTAEWERVRYDLPALFEWQREIAMAEAARLEAYFRAGDERKGVPPQPDREVEREWPVLPVKSDQPVII